MEPQKFYDTIEELIDECLEIMKAKGLAYSGKQDSFANFKRVAKNLSMSQYDVWYVYFAKHLDSLASWIREEYSDSEPIESRIKDLINYLFLLYGMIAEDKKKECGCPEPGTAIDLNEGGWQDFDDSPFHGKIKVVETDGEETDSK